MILYIILGSNDELIMSQVFPVRDDRLYANTQQRYCKIQIILTEQC